MSESLLWVEKYRPKTIEDCILPETIKTTLRDVVKQNKIPNMMFTGTSGIGKTTAARAICNETKADYLIINGSDEGRMIDTLRTKLTQFCSTISLSGSRKVVIIDEADYMNADSVQPAMRNFTERFADNCSFIFATFSFAVASIDSFLFLSSMYVPITLSTVILAIRFLLY